MMWMAVFPRTKVAKIYILLVPPSCPVPRCLRYVNQSQEFKRTPGSCAEAEHENTMSLRDKHSDTRHCRNNDSQTDGKEGLLLPDSAAQTPSKSCVRCRQQG